MKFKSFLRDGEAGNTRATSINIHDYIMNWKHVENVLNRVLIIYKSTHIKGVDRNVNLY